MAIATKTKVKKSLTADEVFQEFSWRQKNRHQYAQDWKKRTGKQMLGYFCTYAPEEIAYAAGVLPVRILGGHEPEDVSAKHIYSMYCPFCRDVLAQGLKGKYNYLDGVTIAQSCLHIRQAFFSWKLHIPLSFAYYLYHPMKVQSPRAVPYLAGELARFKKAVEEWVGKDITDEALDKAIGVYNDNRRLLTQMYETRKADTPPFSGVEAMEMVLASQLTDKVEVNDLLRQALAGLPHRTNRPKPGVRLMIVGSEDDDTEFLSMVESLDSNIVIDEHCTGTRYFWTEVSPQPDRLMALAKRYVERVPCPSKDWEKRNRADHVLRLAKEYKVQAALLTQQKFCDPHECDIPALKEMLEANGIPCLFLEFDITTPAGQFRTRVEAFLETIREGELF